MAQKSGGLVCTLTCWGIGGLGGLLLAILLVAWGGFAIVAGIFLGGVAALIAGAALTWAFCRPLPGPNEVVIDPPVPGEDRANRAAPNTTADTPAASAPSAPAPTAAHPGPTAVAASKSGAAAVQPSKALAGEADLASRKGTWTYEADGETSSAKAKDTPTEPKAEKPAPAPAPKPASDEEVDVGSKPELLSAAREGGPDDLKQIKGVGVVMEDMLHGMGIYHFDQVAGWSPEEVEWVDANLPKFKGRVSRDDWVEQAKILAAGGETEFSKKVEKGGVYD